MCQEVTTLILKQGDRSEGRIGVAQLEVILKSEQKRSWALLTGH
jgi:hypothetical protein